MGKTHSGKITVSRDELEKRPAAARRRAWLPERSGTTRGTNPFIAVVAVMGWLAIIAPLVAMHFFRTAKEAGYQSRIKDLMAQIAVVQQETKTEIDAAKQAKLDLAKKIEEEQKRRNVEAKSQLTIQAKAAELGTELDDLKKQHEEKTATADREQQALDAVVQRVAALTEERDKLNKERERLVTKYKKLGQELEDAVNKAVEGPSPIGTRGLYDRFKHTKYAACLAWYTAEKYIVTHDQKTAKQYFELVINEYADSPYAEDAKTRLEELADVKGGSKRFSEMSPGVKQCKQKPRPAQPKTADE